MRTHKGYCPLAAEEVPSSKRTGALGSVTPPFLLCLQTSTVIHFVLNTTRAPVASPPHNKTYFRVWILSHQCGSQHTLHSLSTYLYVTYVFQRPNMSRIIAGFGSEPLT